MIAEEWQQCAAAEAFRTEAADHESFGDIEAVVRVREGPTGDVVFGNTEYLQKCPQEEIFKYSKANHDRC